MKRCIVCKVNKSQNEFYKNKSNKTDGLQASCIVCYKSKVKDRKKQNPRKFYLKNREWVKNNPQKNKSHQLKHIYGITLEEYNKMLEKQNNCCAICNVTLNEHLQTYGKYLSVDHDHKTGQIRGLLCDKHNKALGLFEDNTFILQNAIEYLGG